MEPAAGIACARSRPGSKSLSSGPAGALRTSGRLRLQEIREQADRSAATPASGSRRSSLSGQPPGQQLPPLGVRSAPCSGRPTPPPRPASSGSQEVQPWLDRGHVTSERTSATLGREESVLIASTTGSSYWGEVRKNLRTQRVEVNNISQVEEALAEHREELSVPYKSLGQRLGAVIEKWVMNPRNRNATRVFDLQKNHLGLLGTKSVLKAVKCGQVTRLNLARNMLGPDAGKIIAEVLKANPKLLVLDLRGNPLEGEGCAAIADALETNTTLTDLDLSETGLDPASGQRIATVLRRSNLRRLVVDGNGLNSSTLAMIEASLCFQPAIWNGSAKATVALEKAIRLDPSVGPDMVTDFLAAVVNNWPRDDPNETSSVVAALQAPLAVQDRVLDSAGTSSEDTSKISHLLEYSSSRLSELCQLYLPLGNARSHSKASRPAGESLAGSWEQVDLPRGRFPADGLLVLNLTPFPVTVGKEREAVAPLGHLRMAWARPPQLPARASPCPSEAGDASPPSSARGVPPRAQPARELPQLDLPAVVDCSRLAGGMRLDVPVDVRQAVGECRYCLDRLAGSAAGRAQHGAGALRAMFSVKDYPSIGTAQLLLLAWEPPPALRGVRLADLERRWQEYNKSSAGHETLKRVVSLRCFAGGKQLAAPSTSRGRATACGDKEDKRLTRFELLRQGDGRVCLRSLCGGSEGSYLTVHKEDAACSVRLGASGAQFQMVDNGDGTFSFRTVHGCLAIFEDDSVGTLPQSESRGRTRSHFQVESGPNMYEVVKYWISPETAVAHCSFASLFDYGPPDTFVSHYWGHSFDDLLKSSRLHGSVVAGGDDAAGSRRRLWICSFANDQRRVSEELGSDIDESAFKKALESRTCSAMALMFGEDGAPLQRCWCLYEILLCEYLQLPLDICTPKGVVNRGGTRVDNGIDVLETCNRIDVGTATCSNPEDAKKIRAKIESSLGYERMNHTIRTKMVDGLDKAFELQVDRLKKAVDTTGIQEDGDPQSPGMLTRRRSWARDESPSRRSDDSLGGFASARGSPGLEEENAQLKKRNARLFEKLEKMRLENVRLKLETGRLQEELDDERKKKRKQSNA